MYGEAPRTSLGFVQKEKKAVVFLQKIVVDFKSRLKNALEIMFKERKKNETLFQSRPS